MGLLFAGAALVAAILLQALLTRLARSPGSVAMFLGAALTSGVALGVAMSEEFGIGADTMAALLIYGCGCEFYIFLSTFSLASISSNILALLRKRPLSAPELASRYASEAMVKVRISRLLAAGFIIEDAGILRLTPKGERTAALFETMSSLFGQFRDDRHYRQRRTPLPGNSE